MKKIVLIFLLLPLFALAESSQDMIMKLSEKERIEFFNSYIVYRGGVCDVSKTFFQGRLDDKEEYLWNVKCNKGEDQAFYIDVDDVMRMMPCSMFTILTELKCFKKLD